MKAKVNLAEKLALLERPFAPGIVGYLKDYKLQVVPRADEEAHVLLIEPRGTVNTGDAASALTAPEVEL